MQERQRGPIHRVPDRIHHTARSVETTETAARPATSHVRTSDVRLLPADAQSVETTSATAAGCLIVAEPVSTVHADVPAAACHPPPYSQSGNSRPEYEDTAEHIDGQHQ